MRNGKNLSLGNNFRILQWCKKQMNYYASLGLRLLTPLIITYSVLEKIFYPLTIYIPYYILNLLKVKTFIFQPYLITSSSYIRVSDACAVISAYFLLLILVIITKDISLKKRIKIFMFGSIIILTINLARILSLIYILENYGFNAFQQTHDFLWLILGSVLVAFTWIFLIKHYKVKSIPIYSDIKYLLKQVTSSP